ncbi:MAG: HAD family hydrolase, partial [Rhodanobacter sp.]
MQIRALTLDLDDTLWPVLPALERADQAVDAWLRQHHPEVARAWPITAMRELRAQIAAERVDLAHDFTTQRQLTMRHAFAACGIATAPIDVLWEIYFAARNSVELYPDSLPALQRITARWPVVSLTNGNADLQRIGIHAHFAHQICSRDTGMAKPDPRIFLAAAELLGLAPTEILHV